MITTSAVDNIPCGALTAQDIPKRNTAQKVRVLQTAQEDFEWYPTTDEILAAFRADLYAQAKERGDNRYHNNSFSHRESYSKDEPDCVSIESMPDVGAGDGRVFDAIRDIDSGHLFEVKKKYGIEIARAQADDLICKHGVFLIGRDFFKPALIDKKYDVIFSNPPYSLYEDWTLRLLVESSFPRPGLSSVSPAQTG